MNAQIMYDLRQKYEFCSGQDLAEWFLSQTGTMSPSGGTTIEKYEAIAFQKQCFDAIAKNSPVLASWAKNAEQEAFLELVSMRHSL